MIVLAIAQAIHGRLHATNLNLNQQFTARTVHKCVHIIVHNCSSHIHCVSKTSHLWFAITLAHMNPFWYFFVLLRALPGKTRKHENCIFHSNARIHCLISSIFWLDSRLILTLLYDSPDLAMNASSYRDWWAWFRRKGVESAPADRLCCTHNAPVHCLLGFLFRKVVLKH